MIEVPAAALNAEQFAQEVDFFSIGTNDLLQYLMAVDRSEANLAYLNDSYNPVFLRLIQFVIQAAHKKKKWVSMCGEMAGEPQAIALLIGMGLNKFSMISNYIGFARSKIAHLNRAEMKKMSKKALLLNESIDIIQYIEESIER
jgi:phosphotransferase system enzyme I (PtsI)